MGKIVLEPVRLEALLDKMAGVTAMVVGDDLLYLDANIPAEHGGNPDTYFAVTPGSNGIYRNDLVKMVEYSPDLMTTTVYSP